MVRYGANLLMAAAPRNKLVVLLEFVGFVVLVLELVGLVVVLVAIVEGSFVEFVVWLDH